MADDAADKKSTGPNFDRIKPANPAPPTTGPLTDAREDDVQGKRALFSGAEQPPAIGSVAIDCNTCGRRSIVSYVRLMKMVTTGFFMPLPVYGQRAWLKCPACSQHSWVMVTRS